jgi:hypothetical protein
LTTRRRTRFRTIPGTASHFLSPLGFPSGFLASQTWPRFFCRRASQAVQDAREEHLDRLAGQRREADS